MQVVQRGLYGTTPRLLVLYARCLSAAWGGKRISENGVRHFTGNYLLFWVTYATGGPNIKYGLPTPSTIYYLTITQFLPFDTDKRVQAHLR